LSHQAGPFVTLPPQQSPTRRPQQQEDLDNETDGEGQVVQESIIRPKLPSGQNHESLDEDDVKDLEEFDNFVYHKITAASTTDSPRTTTERERETPAQTETTRMSSFASVSTERFVATTERK
jgi:hypothetical protein